MTFVVIEGIDGLGKTTLLKNLKDHYPDAIFTHEPYDHSWVQTHVKNKHPFEKLLYYLGDRFEHNRSLLKPQRGQLIFCDRYALSNIFYQGRELKDVDLMNLQHAHMYVEMMQDSYIFEMPDLTIVLYTKENDDTVIQRVLNEVKEDESEYDRLMLINSDYLYESSTYANSEVVRVCVDFKSEQNLTYTVLEELRSRGY